MQGIRLFPAVFSYPQDPTLNHWPGMINLLQSRRFSRRSSGSILPLFKQRENPLTGSLPIGEHVHFFDSLLNVTYVIYRLDLYILLWTIHDGFQTEFDGMMDLIKKLESVLCPKDLFN